MVYDVSAVVIMGVDKGFEIAASPVGVVSACAVDSVGPGDGDMQGAFKEGRERTHRC